MEIPQLFKESRYGIPAADQILPNRNYLIGYSYLFRQPRWAAAVITSDATSVTVDRQDAFRPDLRIPEQFRADLADYAKSGYDRGHLVPSADRNASRLENSETFLLSNMSPQTPELNRHAWRLLEDLVRDIARQPEVVEVYSISGPVFKVGAIIKIIGDDVPVPHAFFKTVLIEDAKGRVSFQSWILPNLHDDFDADADFWIYKTSVANIEKLTGLLLWDRLHGKTIDRLKEKT